MKYSIILVDYNRIISYIGSKLFIELSVLESNIRLLSKLVLGQLQCDASELVPDTRQADVWLSKKSVRLNRGISSYFFIELLTCLIFCFNYFTYVNDVI